MKQTNHYTAKDIERYQSGQMSVGEMHALEKAALDDPFLADAIDGYRNTQTLAADLSVLQEKLALRIEKDGKRRPVFFMQSGWMKIAALFLLFAGSGWLVYQLLSVNNSNKEVEVATNQPTPKLPELRQATDSASVTLPDKSRNTNTVLLEEEKYSTEANLGDKVAGTTTSVQSTAPPANQAIAKRQDESKSLNEIAILRAPVSADSSFAGYSRATKEKDNAKAVAVDTIRNVNVTMQPTMISAEDVVVLSNKQPLAKKRMQIVVDTLEPAEGWTNFDDYIASNLKTPEEYRAKPIRGEVELSFDVNRQGEPVNIAVVKSLCEKCDEEAIRLLKEGPRWKQNRKKGKVRIKF